MAHNILDLQIQSTASDGMHPPRELIAMARGAGLEVIAITDHDTVGGVSEALMSGSEIGVRVISGVEFSVEEYDAHILGYGIDHTNTKLLEEFKRSQEGRMRGAHEIVTRFREAGFAVEWEDVLKEAKGLSVTRPHIVRAILARPENKEKLGGVETADDFFKKYFGEGSPFYVRRTHIAAHRAIGLLHEAGGVAVWSHPALAFPGGKYEELETCLKKMIEWGIDGVEMFNPSAHTEDDVEFINGLASKYNLLRTAGSDFHERGPHPRDLETGLHHADSPGDYETYGFPTDDIIPKLDEAIQNVRSRKAV